MEGTYVSVTTVAGGYVEEDLFGVPVEEGVYVYIRPQKKASSVPSPVIWKVVEKMVGIPASKSNLILAYSFWRDE